MGKFEPVKWNPRRRVFNGIGWVRTPTKPKRKGTRKESSK